MDQHAKTIAATRRLIAVTTRLVRESNCRITHSSKHMPASALAGPLPEWEALQRRLRDFAEYRAEEQERERVDRRQRAETTLSLRSLAAETCILTQQTCLTARRMREACAESRRVAMAQFDRAVLLRDKQRLSTVATRRGVPHRNGPRRAA